MAANPPPLVAHFDGLCEPANPGGWGCGGWWLDTDPPIEGWRVYGREPAMTNNRTEFSAALDALRAVYATGWRGPVILRGDSQVVIRQLTGAYQCHAPALVPLRAAVLHGATFFASVSYEWVPRTENMRADALSRLAYRVARERERPAPPVPQRAVRADTGAVAAAREERLHPIEILMRRGRRAS